MSVRVHHGSGWCASLAVALAALAGACGNDGGAGSDDAGGGGDDAGGDDGGGGDRAVVQARRRLRLSLAGRSGRALAQRVVVVQLGADPRRGRARDLPDQRRRVRADGVGRRSVDDADTAIPADARYLLAFNEPNFGSQANLTAAEAAALWPQLEQVADRHGLDIVSPALNYCGGACNATSPFDWFDDFFAACPDCRVDALAVHWYACSEDALRNYIEQMKTVRQADLADRVRLPRLVQRVGAGPAGVHGRRPRLPRVRAGGGPDSWFSARFQPAPTIDLLGASGELDAAGRAVREHRRGVRVRAPRRLTQRPVLGWLRRSAARPSRNPDELGRDVMIRPPQRAFRAQNSSSARAELSWS